MDRFDVINFADLSGPDGAPQWVKIGGGSFGVVFQGEYLGTSVAIKEVLPNNTYDVEKYFERECVLMKEARHPNIVQYIGLTKSPGPDGRIYIISEFVGGNLRSFIADKRKPFPWRLRISFATDIARALAYLHARNCMHRDLKGENLLITANDRIKVCDFGFARIAARNEEEMRRISYCGTDGYMSPEILMGVDFSLPSDIFSLGIIFCEILSRHLVDANTFKRVMPTFGINPDEVHEMASEGCPPEFIQLALDCVEEDPDSRPKMREIVRRLREIETKILIQQQQELAQQKSANGKEEMYAVGSVRGSSLHAVLGSTAKANQKKKKKTEDAAGVGSKRPSMAPKMPSFSGKVNVSRTRQPSRSPSEGSTSSSDDMDEAIAALEQIGIDPSAAAESALMDARMPVDPQSASALAAANAVSSTLRRGKGKITLDDTLKAGSTFKVSGYGNPWWGDEADRQTLPSINGSWIRNGGALSNAPSRRGIPGEGARTSSILTVRRGSGPDVPADEEAEQYSTSVIRSSKVTNGHAPLASTMSALTARQKEEEEGPSSTLTIKQPKPVRVGGGPSTSNFLAHGTADDEADATAAGAGVDSPQASYLTAKSHRGEPSIANATIAASSIRGVAPTADAAPAAAAEPELTGPTPLLHRFTLVKNGMKKPSNLTATANVAASGIAGSAFGSLLPPAIMLTNALAKCWVCGKRIGWKPFLDCDDCPYKTHVACGELAEPTCQELVLPPARSGSSTPVVSAEQASAARRLSRSKSPDQASVSAAAAALKAAALNSDAAAAAKEGSSSPNPASGKENERNGFGKLLKSAAKRSSFSPPPLSASISKRGAKA